MLRLKIKCNDIVFLERVENVFFMLYNRSKNNYFTLCTRNSFYRIVKVVSNLSDKYIFCMKFSK